MDDIPAVVLGYFIFVAGHGIFSFGHDMIDSPVGICFYGIVVKCRRGRESVGANDRAVTLTPFAMAGDAEDIVDSLAFFEVFLG